MSAPVPRPVISLVSDSESDVPQEIVMISDSEASQSDADRRSVSAALPIASDSRPSTADSDMPLAKLGTLGQFLEDEAAFNADVSDNGTPSRPTTPLPAHQRDAGDALDTPTLNRVMQPNPAAPLASSSARAPPAPYSPRFPLPDDALNQRRYVANFPKIGQHIEEGFAVADPGCSTCVKRGLICSWGTGFDHNGKTRKTQCDFCAAQHLGKCDGKGYVGKNVGANKRKREAEDCIEGLHDIVLQYVTDKENREVAINYLFRLRKCI